MIVIKADNVLTATREAYDTLLKGSPNSSDPSIFKEDSAAIEISPSDISLSGFSIKNNKFVYENDYSQYLPRVAKELVREEEIDYSRIFLASKSVDAVVDYIKQIPDSRRNVISVWSPTYLDPAIVGVCITQLYFRLRDGALELHSHGRANDAYRLLLLDMQLAMCIQKDVAKRVGVDAGMYIHFSDSLHLYKKYQEDIEWQHELMATNPIWQV